MRVHAATANNAVHPREDRFNIKLFFIILFASINVLTCSFAKLIRAAFILPTLSVTDNRLLFEKVSFVRLIYLY